MRPTAVWASCESPFSNFVSLRIADEYKPSAVCPYPEDDCWREYDFGQFALALGLSPVMGLGTRSDQNSPAWRLGDSDIVVSITCAQQSFATSGGKFLFVEYCRNLADAMALALPGMSDGYAEVYQYMLSDIGKNGVFFPEYGQIAEPYSPTC